MIDVFIGLEYLTEKDVKAWRMKHVTYLEKSIKTNLARASFIVKTVRSNCINGKLKASFTSYKSWGKGPKVALWFSKTGKSNIEEAYATHFIKPPNMA